jgi:protein phosphatase
VDDVLDLDDVIGKRIIPTRLRGRVTVREENAAAALEVMSRFAANPKWLIYLPPTMSPAATSAAARLLEHPAEAFAYYRSRGRADGGLRGEAHGIARGGDRLPRRGAARRRFGVARRGHRDRLHAHRPPLLQRHASSSVLLGRVRAAADACGLWDELGTDWVCLDAELMPWSAKAQELLRGQYAAVGAAARASLGAAVEILGRLPTADRGLTSSSGLSSARCRRVAMWTRTAGTAGR